MRREEAEGHTAQEAKEGGAGGGRLWRIETGKIAVKEVGKGRKKARRGMADSEGW